MADLIDKWEVKALGLVGECNAHHRECIKAGNEMAKNAYDAGRILNEIKQIIPHGLWRGWVDQHCDFSLRICQCYIKLSKDLQKLPKSARAALLESNSIRAVAAAVAKDAAPEKNDKPAKEPTALKEQAADVETDDDSDTGPIYSIYIYEGEWVKAFDEFWSKCPAPMRAIISDRISPVEPTIKDDGEFPKALNTKEFLKSWGDWLAHKGKAYKKSGRTAQLKRLEKLGAKRAIEAIEYSIAQGYDGVFEEKSNGKTARASLTHEERMKGVFDDAN